MTDKTHGSTAFAAEQYKASSSQASTIVRSLALSSIAVIWLFAGGLTPQDASPQQLLDQISCAGWLQVGLITALVSLFFDLVQYVWATALWGGYHRALYGVLERDDSNKPFTGDVRSVWERAAAWGIVRQIEVVTQADSDPANAGAELKGKGKNDQKRMTAARTSLHTALTETGDTFTPLRRWAEAPVSPPIIRGGTITFFVVKVVALVVSFACVGQFLIWG